MTPDEAVTEIQRAARGVAPAELHAAAVAEGVQVPKRKFGRRVALAEVYADGAALLDAVTGGEPTAVAAGLRALGRLDPERVLAPAIPLAEGPRGVLQVAAAYALAHSHDDRALDVLARALDPGSTIPTGALGASVHPGAARCARDALASTGMTTFEVRPRPTLGAWRALPDDERARLDAMQPEGRPSAALERACAAVTVLGLQRDAASVELVIRLFEAHPDDRLRLACAHALASWPDPRAHAAVDARWGDAVQTIRTICVRGALLRELATAWDRFARPIDAVLAAPPSDPPRLDCEIVATLLYACHGGSTPRTLQPDPLVVEPRLVDLAARLRRHPELGSTARMVLEVAPRADAIAAIERHPHAPPPAAPVPRPSRRDFLARYQAGEHAVWDELRALAPAIAQHADLREEAAAVARALMARVRANADAVRAVMREAGAVPGGEAAPATDAELARVVELGGPLPIALEAFWRVVGGIALTPAGDRYHYAESSLERDGLSLIALDPLELCGARELSYELDAHAKLVAASHREIVGPLHLALAPDFLHKQDISGGPPYTILLPAETPEEAVDPPLCYARREPPLVEYLRHAFRYGGFPLLELAALPLDEIHVNDRIAFARVAGDRAAAADALLARLRRDVVAF